MGYLLVKPKHVIMVALLLLAQDLELTVGSNVTAEGLQHLQRLTSLSTLELTGVAMHNVYPL